MLEGEPLTLGRVRITWTGGPSPLGSDRGDGPPSLVVVAAPMDPWPDTDGGGDRAVAAQRAGRARRPQDHVVRRERARPGARPRARGASEAVFANLQGHLCEGTGTNVFYVVDGELRTPTLASGCLAGITRHLVLEWYGASEVDEPIEVLADASEVFLASTTRDVQAIARWDDRDLAAPGPGHHRGPEGVAGARAGAARALTHRGCGRPRTVR